MSHDDWEIDCFGPIINLKMGKLSVDMFEEGFIHQQNDEVMELFIPINVYDKQSYSGKINL